MTIFRLFVNFLRRCAEHFSRLSEPHTSCFSRRYFFWLVVAALPVTATAQSQYEFYYNNALAEDGARIPEVDSELFMKQLGDGTKVFDRLAEYNFSFVRHERYGFERWMNSKFALDGSVSHSPDYQLYSVLRPAATADGFSSDARALIREGWRFQGLAFNRRGRGGGRASWAGENAEGSVYGGISASYRTGRDPRIGGVFMDEASVLGAVSWRDFSVATAVLHSSSGLRSYATREAFTLTGDRFYNPSWGLYGGKEHSSNTINRQSINTLLSWSRTIGGTAFFASFGGQLGRTARSGLAWFDAATPYPDYYRYMPDYDPVNSADPWHLGDQRVTQIYWEQLVEQNQNRIDQAAYILENRVEDVCDFAVKIGGATKFSGGWGLSYSADFQYDSRVRYKQVGNLLGAAPFRDIDRFLLDDEIFGEQHLNNAQNPDLLIGMGDRFGYYYSLTALSMNAEVTIDYRKEGLYLLFGLRAGSHRLQRHGFYEKEIFPSGLSVGKSMSYEFSPWSGNASAQYVFSPRHFIDFTVNLSEKAPYADNIFVNPDYSNIAIEQPMTVKTFNTKLDYTAVLERFGLNISAFFTTTRDESAIYRYWDDIASAYADMAVNQLDKSFAGVEIGAEWEISPRFSFSMGGAMGRYVYSSDAQAVITDDASRRIIADGVRARLKNYRLATAPEHLATAEIQYDTWGWIASLSANYASGRYVAITPLRRTKRAYGLAGSPERHQEFIEQEELSDAFSLNLFIMRSFEVANGRLTATLSINNLLDTDNINHGYEQMRIQRSGVVPTQNWIPFPSKYLYNYGRTYYVSATYSF